MVLGWSSAGLSQCTATCTASHVSTLCTHQPVYLAVILFGHGVLCLAAG